MVEAGRGERWDRASRFGELKPTHLPLPPKITETRMRARWISLRTGDRIGPVRRLLPRFRDAFIKRAGITGRVPINFHVS